MGDAVSSLGAWRAGQATARTSTGVSYVWTVNFSSELMLTSLTFLEFASNCGLRFLTPEEYFSNAPSVTGPMLGWDPRSYNRDCTLQPEIQTEYSLTSHIL